ncbi:MAG: hypothetical protein QNJ69_14680 [Gammaproteobacteria bacterium]|nr:hypothetical protein [Gammaproteobacteria bacterium]
MKSIKLAIFLFFSSIALVSCGGGSSSGGGSGGGLSYDGNTSQATVDDVNSGELAIAATGAVGSAVGGQYAPLRPSPADASLLAISQQMGQVVPTSNRTANQTVDFTADFCDQGSAIANVSDGSNTANIQFTDCQSSLGLESITMNGSLILTAGTDGSYTAVYQNFRITSGGETYTLNATATCDANFICTIVSDFAGPDGRVYRIENFSVFATGSNSYNVTATVYDPDNGYVSITANVTYGDCAGGVPVSGSITFTGSGGSFGTVTFNDCASFTVTDASSTTDYQWADIL